MVTFSPLIAGLLFLGGLNVALGGGRVFGPLNSHFRKAFRKSKGGTRGTLGVGGSNVASLGSMQARHRLKKN